MDDTQKKELIEYLERYVDTTITPAEAAKHVHDLVHKAIFETLGGAVIPPAKMGRAQNADGSCREEGTKGWPELRFVTRAALRFQLFYRNEENSVWREETSNELLTPLLAHCANDALELIKTLTTNLARCITELKTEASGHRISDNPHRNRRETTLREIIAEVEKT